MKRLLSTIIPALLISFAVRGQEADSCHCRLAAETAINRSDSLQRIIDALKPLAKDGISSRFEPIFSDSLENINVEKAEAFLTLTSYFPDDDSIAESRRRARLILTAKEILANANRYLDTDTFSSRLESETNTLLGELLQQDVLNEVQTSEISSAIERNSNYRSAVMFLMAMLDDFSSDENYLTLVENNAPEGLLCATFDDFVSAPGSARRLKRINEYPMLAAYFETFRQNAIEGNTEAMKTMANDLETLLQPVIQPL